MTLYYKLMMVIPVWKWCSHRVFAFGIALMIEQLWVLEHVLHSALAQSAASDGSLV